jgi:hypothetical protein
MIIAVPLKNMAKHGSTLVNALLWLAIMIAGLMMWWFAAHGK